MIYNPISDNPTINICFVFMLALWDAGDGVLLAFDRC
jgi:hypothetical protein